MIAAGIVISWSGSEEYIEIDLDNLGQLSSITSTLDCWHKQKSVVRYNTRSEVKHLSSGAVELILHYDQRGNPHIYPPDSLWGSTTIKLVAGENSGEASWQDNDDSTNDGTVSWKRVANGLFKEKKREVISRLQRDQAKFRSALLAYETRCALTGECSIDVLEAAHIIPSKDGGGEVIQNGILLRADLHRLYDAGKFLINPSGQVVDIKDVSPAYLTILSTSRIPDQTIQRTRLALLHQWNVSAQ